LVIGVLLGTVLVSSAFAQSTDLIYQFDDFSGGLNTKMNQFSLPKSQGDVVENLRLDAEYKSLTKRDPKITSCTAHATDPILGIHRFYMKGGTQVTIVNHGSTIATCDEGTGLPTTILTVPTSSKRWDWTTWHDIAIGTDGSNQPVKYDGTSASATYLGTALAIDAGSGTGPTGTYTYKVACTTSSYDILLGVESNSVVMAGNDITLSMIPICPDSILGESVNGREVYRNKNGESTWYLLSNGDINNNTTVSITDSDTDAELGAAISEDATYTVPKGRFGLVHKNRLWLGNNSDNPSRLFYSEDASHDYFDSSAYFNIRPNDGDEITCLQNWLGLLTVSKNNTWQKIDTRKDDPDADWEVTDPYSFIGVQAPYSCVPTDIGIMYLGNNGLYNFNGQYSELLSDPIAPTIKDIQPSSFPEAWAAYYKNSYYLTYTSTETGAVDNDRVLVVDLIGKTFNVDTMALNVLHVFNSGTDIEALFTGSSSSGIIYAHTDTEKGVNHNRHADFDGTFDDIRYIPESVGGEADNPILELAWTTTIDGTNDPDWTGIIDDVTFDTVVIDRPDTDGIYTSDYLTVNASSLDKIYWNETIPSGGGNVTFDLRSGSTTTDCSTAGWTTGFTDPDGGDISSATADTILQYRINMSSNTITQTPTLTKTSGYVVRITYNTAGSISEDNIPIRWRSGWLDLGYPGYVKELRKIYVYYDWDESVSGILNLDFESIQGETDTFNIDLLEYPDYYIDYFPDGNMIGELIRLDITEDSENPIKIRKIMIVFDVQENLT